ncbi:MAG: adenosylcobinamide-phosphate synthase CbiB [Dehalococcoidia bacterium]
MKRRVKVAAIATLLDLALAELPNRFHPVAGLGRATNALVVRLPHSTPRSALASGVFLAVAIPSAAGLLGAAASRTARRHGTVGLVVEAFLLKQAFALRALFAHVERVRRPLATEDIAATRLAAARIVSRDTAGLPAIALASAAIESLAENASDSVVAPLAWYAVAGLPAAFAYRAVNTLDAMVGYRHFGLFGMPSARLDDIANFVPARLTALAITIASCRPATALGTLRDAGRTLSPNSGWPMAAAAHALGVRLEKRRHHVLNASGAEPEAGDIRRVQILVAEALAVLAFAFVCTTRTWRTT